MSGDVMFVELVKKFEWQLHLPADSILMKSKFGFYSHLGKIVLDRGSIKEPRFLEKEMS